MWVARKQVPGQVLGVLSLCNFFREVFTHCKKTHYNIATFFYPIISTLFWTDSNHSLKVSLQVQSGISNTLPWWREFVALTMFNTLGMFLQTPWSRHSLYVSHGEIEVIQWIEIRALNPLIIVQIDAHTPTMSSSACMWGLCATVSCTIFDAIVKPIHFYGALV